MLLLLPNSGAAKRLPWPFCKAKGGGWRQWRLSKSVAVAGPKVMRESAPRPQLRSDRGRCVCVSAFREPNVECYFSLS